MTTTQARLLLALSFLAPWVQAANEARAPGLIPGEISPIAVRPQVLAPPPALSVDVEISAGGLSLPTVPAVDPEVEASASEIVPARPASEQQRAPAQKA